MKSALVGMFLWCFSYQDEDWYEDRRMHTQEELNSGRDLSTTFLFGEWDNHVASIYELSFTDANCHDGRILDFEGSSIPLVWKLAQQTMLLHLFCCRFNPRVLRFNRECYQSACESYVRVKLKTLGKTFTSLSGLPPSFGGLAWNIQRWLRPTLAPYPILLGPADDVSFLREPGLIRK
jgi:hypothetical protein